MNKQNHHYVPQFYLKNWASGSDHKFEYFQWKNRTLVNSRISPKGTAYEVNLYSMEEVLLEKKQEIEKFINAEIDAPASSTLNKIFQDGVQGLSAEEKYHWAKFLVSLRVRHPKSIETAKMDGRNMFLDILTNSEAEYQALRGAQDPPTFIDFCNQIDPALTPNMGILAISKWMIDTKMINIILNMYWWVMNASGEEIDFLTSNIPCIYTTGLGDPNCIMGLPISPTTLFLASNNPDFERQISAHPKREVIYRTNIQMLDQKGVNMIYSTNDKQYEFIKENLKP